MIPTKEQKIDEKLAQMFRDRSDGAGGLREFSWAEFINEAVSFYHTIRESDRAEVVKELKAIMNKSKTEKGLGMALGNYIKRLGITKE